MTLITLGWRFCLTNNSSTSKLLIVAMRIISVIYKTTVITPGLTTICAIMPFLQWSGVHCQQPIQPHTDSEKLKDYCWSLWLTSLSLNRLTRLIASQTRALSKFIVTSTSPSPVLGFAIRMTGEGDQHKCNGKDDIESEIIQIITIVHATNGNPVKTFKQL